MGMLLTYRKGYWSEAEKPKARRTRRRKPQAEQPAAPAPEASPYSELTDEQVAEAYATTFPEGEATERDAQVVQLRAVAAFAHTFAAE